jgi:hypothetical protein
MINDNYYKRGSWNVICQRCGFKHKAEEVKKEWTGLVVCKPCFEHRHVADFIRGRQEKQTVPFTADEPTDTFTTVTYVASTVGTQDNTIPSGTNHGDL